MSIRLPHEATAPPTPPASRSTLYFDANGILQGLDSSGTNINIVSPAGAIMQFAGSTAPDGWLICDGSSKLVATYSVLQGVIGYTYGGSGANFNVPDLRGRCPIGVGTGAGLSARALADSSGQEKITDVPTHSHNMQGIDDTAISTIGAGRFHADGGLAYRIGSPDLELGATSNTGSASVDVMNPFLALNFIIKT